MWDKSKRPRGCEGVWSKLSLLLMTISLDAFAILVLRHLGATFFLDRTHGRAPWWLVRGLENDLIEGQFDEALRTGGTQCRDDGTHLILKNHRLNSHPSFRADAVDSRSIE